MTRLFIDGREGTTGLRIAQRFVGRNDVELLTLAENERKSTACRREAINAADIVFLCLPDAAAREAVSLVENPHTRIIDASTAHRTADGWAYGFPELSPKHRQAIADGDRVAVCGCHAGGFVALVYPLRAAGLMPADYPISCTSLTGFSGGGKKMIAEYQSENRDSLLDSPRLYGLTQQHKHLPEMTTVCRLDTPPIFLPIVSDFYCGMAVTVSIFPKLMSRTVSVNDLLSFYAEYYSGQPLMKVMTAPDEGLLASNNLAGLDTMEIHVNGCDDRITVTARFDNLGKGASGTAVQCMNIMLGLDETTSLQTKQEDLAQ